MRPLRIPLIEALDLRPDVISIALPQRMIQGPGGRMIPSPPIDPSNFFCTGLEISGPGIPSGAQIRRWYGKRGFSLSR